jgi:hypothetical protein
LVKSTLDDLTFIEEQARNSALVFNAANVDHETSIKGVVFSCIFPLGLTF